MKNSISTITTVLSVVFSLNLSAQHRSRGNEHQISQQQNQGQTQYQSYDTRWGHGHNNGWNNWGGGVTVHIGNTPNYGYNNYGYGNNYYSNYNNNNYYSVKRAARNLLRQAAQTIGNALQFSDWNDTYSPWLAKAIRHQQYAKQLYFWGDYAGALNHAERANFLAYNTLTYFNNGGGYNNGYGSNGNYQDPYQDPNNPYYRKGNSQSTNPNSTSQNNTSTNNSDDDFGYRKGQDTQAQVNSKDQNANTDNQSNANTGIQKSEVDSQLPQSKLTDQELLKTNAKELDVE